MRTWLTCGTLNADHTFAMICFTSVNSDIVDEATATGKAPYQGLLIKREYFQTLHPTAELFATATRYSHRFHSASPYAPRHPELGGKAGSQPPVSKSSRDTGETNAAVDFDSVLHFSFASRCAGGSRC
jgi:hypothetical protein